MAVTNKNKYGISNGSSKGHACGRDEPGVDPDANGDVQNAARVLLGEVREEVQRESFGAHRYFCYGH